MYEGIADYLEVMRLAGVSEVLKPTKHLAGTPVAKTSEERLRFSREAREEQTVAEHLHLAGTPALETTTDDSKAARLRRLADEVAKCELCKELQKRTQTVFGVGNPDSPLVFLGEAPGADEDKRGEPFVGRAGQLLTDIITKGMKLRREDVYICNILRCRPPGNRTPLPEESAHCRPFLERTLEIISPKFICCLGAVAAQNLLASEKTIGALRGKIWEYKGIKVICTYHPAYLLRNPSAKKDVWEDIKILMREMEMMT
jgi:DNA polymerase